MSSPGTTQCPWSGLAPRLLDPKASALTTRAIRIYPLVLLSFDNYVVFYQLEDIYKVGVHHKLTASSTGSSCFTFFIASS